MAILQLALLSWVLGLTAYCGTLGFVFHQSPWQDFGAVLFWSGMAGGIATILMYLPLFRLFGRVAGRRKRVFVLALAGALVFPLPTLFILGASGGVESGVWRALSSSEAILFHILFAVMGATFGTGMGVLEGRATLRG